MFLISDRGQKLLIDCGSDIRFSLHELGFSHGDVTDIYISHLHADHVGGLEYVGLSRKFDPQCDRPKLYLSKDVATEIWEASLAGGMRSLQQDLASLDSYFQVQPIAKDGYFHWENIKLRPIAVVHVDNGYFLMPSYGLVFMVDGRKVCITTDTQLFGDRLRHIYEQADVIFHDCEISSHPTGVHAHYQELAALPAPWKAKMWLYGFQPGPLPPAEADGFLGFVQKGQLFDFQRPSPFTVPTPSHFPR